MNTISAPTLQRPTMSSMGNTRGRVGRARLGHRLLSAEEERALLEAYKLAGDKGARDELVAHNLRLVRKEARTAHQRWGAERGPSAARSAPLTLEDLEQEGIIGLLKAVDAFDFAREVRFATYATVRVRTEIVRALKAMDGPVRIPEQMRRWMDRYVEASFDRENVVSVQSGRKCGELRAKRIESALLASRSPAYQDADWAECGEDGSPASRAEVFAGAGRGALATDEDHAGSLVLASDETILEAALCTLPEHYREVLVDRYGLFGRPALPLKEIAEREGLTKATVCERAKKAGHRLAVALGEAAGGEDLARQLFATVN